MWILLHLFDPTAAILVNIFTDSSQCWAGQVFSQKRIICRGVGHQNP